MPGKTTLAHAITFEGTCLTEAFDKASAWLRECGMGTDDGTTVCNGTSISYDPETGTVLFTLTLQGCTLPGCCNDGEPGYTQCVRDDDLDLYLADRLRDPVFHQRFAEAVKRSEAARAASES